MKKIPVRQTIVAAYRFAFAGVEKVIALIWLPMIAITVGDYFFTRARLAEQAVALESGDYAQMGPVMVGQFGFAVVELIFICIIGVAISREILSPMESRPSFLRFSLGSTELRAAGGLVAVYMLIAMIALVCVVVGMILSGVLGGALAANALAPEQQAAGVAVLVALVLLPVLLPIFVRLGYFVFPSVLVDGKFGLEKSWEAAKGNVLRIIVISLAVGLPPVLVGELASAFVLGPDSLNPHWSMLMDKAAMDRMAIEQARQMAAHLPILKGIEFVLAPFFYGLVFSAPAFAYKFLRSEDGR